MQTGLAVLRHARGRHPPLRCGPLHCGLGLHQAGARLRCGTAAKADRRTDRATAEILRRRNDLARDPRVGAHDLRSDDSRAAKVGFPARADHCRASAERSRGSKDAIHAESVDRAPKANRRAARGGDDRHSGVLHWGVRYLADPRSVDRDVSGAPGPPATGALPPVASHRGA
jgi:hypothetical protein